MKIINKYTLYILNIYIRELLIYIKLFLIIKKNDINK